MPNPGTSRVSRQTGERRCPLCKDSWPDSQFSNARGCGWKKPPCNACFDERYGKKVRRPCAFCGKPVHTRASAENPTHRACRKGAAA